jgi:hypothetical protein
MRFHRVLATTLLTLSCALAVALPAAGQAKKVTVGGRPTPGQTVRVNIVQDADFTMKPSEAAAGSPMGPMHLTAKTTTVASQKVGMPDEKGNIKVELTFEEITQELKMNDQPAPPEASAGAQALKGKTLSMTLDPAGEVVDVVPPADFPMPPAAIKDMLKQALGLMPKQEMAVGDSVTAPFAMAMPLPMPGGDPPQMKGDLKSTLTGVTGDVAALEQVVTAAVDAKLPGPNGAEVAIKMAVKGSGVTNWDVKGALVRGSKMTTEITGTFTIPNVGAMDLSGTTVVNLERIP